MICWNEPYFVVCASPQPYPILAMSLRLALAAASNTKSTLKNIDNTVDDPLNK